MPGEWEWDPPFRGGQLEKPLAPLEFLIKANRLAKQKATKCWEQNPSPLSCPSMKI